MFLFNVVFISLYQNVFLFSLTAPSYVLLLVSRATGGSLDFIELLFSRALIGWVILEYFADQQQWDYQNAKHRYLDTAKIPSNSPYPREELDRGFVTSGLWAYSRHPNGATEQSIWVTLCLWACYATGTWGWFTFGAINIVLLFRASTWLTELISAGKYPEYKEYQKRVAMFVPKPWQKGTKEWERTSDHGDSHEKVNGATNAKNKGGKKSK
jgi:steroid 5-alpha reductase family enzyme